MQICMANRQCWRPMEIFSSYTWSSPCAIRRPPPTTITSLSTRPILPRGLPEFGEWGAQARYAGITRRSKDYVVAAFKTSIVGGHDWGEGGADDCREVGQLSRYSSSSKQWEIVEVPIPYNPEKGLYQFVWYSDDLFAHDGVLFWVDYHRGILSCDVFAQKPSLKFIQLPEITVWDPDHDYSEGRQMPRAFRSVGVCRGEVKFIDIDNGLYGTRKRSGFTITTWTLKMDQLVWNKDAVLQVDDLWSFPKFYESALPRWFPEFPVISKKDPNIYHFILRGPRSASKAWIITLDMRNMEIESYKPFINEYNPVYDSDLDTKSIFFDTPFVCCDFDPLDATTGSGLGLEFDFSDDNSDDDDYDEFDFSDDDDDDDDDNDDYRYIDSFCQFLRKTELVSINCPARSFQCPACKVGSGSLKWYAGISALMDHARAEQLYMVNLHKKFVALVEEELSRKINSQSDVSFDVPSMAKGT